MLAAVSVSAKTIGYTPGCAPSTRLVRASPILFRPLSPLTSCWSSNTATTRRGSRIPLAARKPPTMAPRGLEIIPTTRLELGVFPPAYLVHQSKVPDGFGDLSWQVKFRAVSATEGGGDYFVGVFLGGSFAYRHHAERHRPHHLVSNSCNRERHRVVGRSSTIGANLPAPWYESSGPGDRFQYRCGLQDQGKNLADARAKFYPLVRRDLGWEKRGLSDTGTCARQFSPRAERLHLSVGGGMQIAVTGFHQYNHRAILSVRLPF
jgi:hypothetical protein